MSLDAHEPIQYTHVYAPAFSIRADLIPDIGRCFLVGIGIFQIKRVQHTRLGHCQHYISSKGHVNHLVNGHHAFIFKAWRESADRVARDQENHEKLEYAPAVRHGAQRRDGTSLFVRTGAWLQEH